MPWGLRCKRNSSIAVAGLMSTAFPICICANDHSVSHLCAGTQHGATLMLPNAGVYTRLADGSKGPRGRHCFQVSVQVPDVLSEEERSILEQLSQLT